MGLPKLSTHLLLLLDARDFRSLLPISPTKIPESPSLRWLVTSHSPAKIPIFHGLIQLSHVRLHLKPDCFMVFKSHKTNVCIYQKHLHQHVLFLRGKHKYINLAVELKCKVFVLYMHQCFCMWKMYQCRYLSCKLHYRCSMFKLV